MRIVVLYAYFELFVKRD